MILPNHVNAQVLGVTRHEGRTERLPITDIVYHGLIKDKHVFFGYIDTDLPVKSEVILACYLDNDPTMLSETDLELYLSGIIWLIFDNHN